MNTTPPSTVTGPVTDRSSTHSDRTTLALQRLAVSRERLLQRLAPRSQAVGDRASAAAGPRMPLRWRALTRILLSRGPSAALGRAAMASLSQWWKNQPWHHSAEMVGRATLQELSPVVRRHPWLTLVAAAGFGAALVAIRPWRVAAVSRYVKPLGGQIAGAAWRLFTQAPVQMALAAALAAWMGDQKGESQAAPAPSDQQNHP